VIFQDLIAFKVGWIIEIVSLRTLNENYIEQERFPKETYLGIELGLRNIAMTEKIATLTLTIHDCLNNFVNATELSHFTVEPNETLNYAYLFLYISKSAYIGRATVYACAYTAPPELNGVPYCPEFSKSFIITTREFFLKIRTEPAGVVTIPGEGWYEEYASANLTAPYVISALTGVRYKFSHWDVDGISKGVEFNQINVFMDANHTATAYYNLQYYLSVRTYPIGIATILGEGWYNEFANVTINAPTVSNFSFQYWDVNDVSRGSGVNPITVHMNAPQIATAHYVQLMTYMLTIITTAGGTTNPAPGTYTYTAGLTIQVEAIPNVNCVLDHWELDEINVGSADPYSVLMDKDHTLKAIFSPAPAAWFIPEWFYWLLLTLLILIIILLLLWLYRRRRKQAAEAFYSGWTAWYYCYDLRRRVRNIYNKHAI